MDVFDFLVGYGAEINVKCLDDEKTPFFYAASFGNCLIYCSNDMKKKIKQCFNLGHLNLVQYLMERDADVKAKDKKGRTPLHHVLNGT